MDKTLCIDGLPQSMTPDDLRNICAEYGSVVSVRVIKDTYGVSLGYGFVKMATEDDAEHVIRALDGSDRLGFPIYVARTYPRPIGRLAIGSA
ncbi:MAG: RNA-binding protein [Nitrospiraceae bacterium]